MKFPLEISREIGRFFYKFAPENPSKFDFFPLKCCKISRFFCEFWLFSREICQFFRQFWLFSREIGRFFREFGPENPAKFCFFFPRNIRSPVSFTKGLKDKAEAYTFHEVLSPSLNHFTRLCSNGAQSPEATEKKFLVARPGILASGAVFS